MCNIFSLTKYYDIEVNQFKKFIFSTSDDLPGANRLRGLFQK
jgi:hypothetical protein